MNTNDSHSYACVEVTSARVSLRHNVPVNNMSSKHNVLGVIAHEHWEKIRASEREREREIDRERVREREIERERNTVVIFPQIHSFSPVSE